MYTFKNPPQCSTSEIKENAQGVRQSEWQQDKEFQMLTYFRLSQYFCDVTYNGYLTTWLFLSKIFTEVREITNPKYLYSAFRQLQSMEGEKRKKYIISEHKWFITVCALVLDNDLPSP